MSTDMIREQALLYATGGLQDDERDAFEELLAGADAELLAEVEQTQMAVEELLLSSPLGGPRPHVKDRLMAAATRTRPSGFEEWAPGIEVLRNGRGAWRRTPFAGVTFQLLHLEQQTRVATTILRLEPGAKYPPHRHSEVEQCLVLSGDVRLGDLHIYAGDFEKALMGTEHGMLTSDTGCELLIIACMDDELLTA